MTRYLLRLKPLECYFFGGERNFGFGRTPKPKSPYMVHSDSLPAQTGLLGMLRFILLSKAGYLSNDINKHYDLKEEAKILVGEKSFGYFSDKAQDFGAIGEIGPLFLMKGDQYYIQMPFNGRQVEEKTVEEKTVGEKTVEEKKSIVECGAYKPYQMKCDNSSGKLRVFPESFSAKLHDTAYYLNTNEADCVAAHRIFGESEQVGIIKNRGNMTEKGYVKKVYRYLKDDYEFAFFAVLDENNSEMQKLNEGVLTEKTIVYLGSEKSCFLLSIQKAEAQEGEGLFPNMDMIKQRMKKNMTGITGVSVYYLASDCSFSSNPNPLFSFAQRNDRRNLMTRGGSDIQNRFEVSARIPFIRAGSVFYMNQSESTCFEKAYDHAPYKKIGLNHVTQLA